MLDELTTLVQLFVVFALTFGPALLLARWRHNVSADWPADIGARALIVASYLALLALGFGAAMLAVPNAARLFT